MAFSITQPFAPTHEQLEKKFIDLSAEVSELEQELKTFDDTRDQRIAEQTELMLKYFHSPAFELVECRSLYSLNEILRQGDNVKRFVGTRPVSDSFTWLVFKPAGMSDKKLKDITEEAAKAEIQSQRTSIAIKHRHAMAEYDRIRDTLKSLYDAEEKRRARQDEIWRMMERS